LAVGPDGSPYISDDIRGRIYCIVYQGGSNAEGQAAKITPCPSASAPVGQVSMNSAKPPEGTDPAAVAVANLPVPANAARKMVAIGEHIFLGQVAGALARVATA
jgi:hypothetical protein